MAKVKLRATLTAVVEYECEEDYDGCKNVSELCRHEETAIREDPTEFCDTGNVKVTAKVERVRDPK